MYLDSIEIEKPAVVLTTKMRNYSLPYFNKVYKTYFKDIAVYANTIRQEIFRVNHSNEYTEAEKEFIVKKKLRPFLYKYKEDIDYGTSLINRIEA